MSYYLRKNQRLLTKKCFQRVIASNLKINGRFIRICYAPTSTHSKLGIVASSHFGNAVERNLFKRRIREIFRKQNVKIKSLEVIIYPQEIAKKCSYKALEKEFLSLFKKI